MPPRKIAVLPFLMLMSLPTARPQSAPNWEASRDPFDVQPVDRITTEIDEAERVPLQRSVHPLAIPANLAGEIPANQAMERMVLVLRPDPSQEEALQELIRAQQDPNSRYYHQWLTPQTFGVRFGVSQNDLAQVAAWLETQGMNVEEIPSSRRAIVFSGAVGQVEAAFHTQMRRYLVNGQAHFANATAPEIPQALAAVVRGFVSLDDFRSAPAHITAPAYTLANGVNLLMPLDWATIYDVLPLYSQGLDGSGQSIAVIGRSDVALTDVETFRANAGLPAKDPQKIFVNGVNPGMPDCSDEAESALDIEWAGALAKNATVDFVTAQSGATDGVVLAAQYTVTNDVAPIVSVSYLACENSISDGGQSLWDQLWAEAAAQGQSVFVASGDSGAAGCDNATEKTATQGKAVNAICSTPNNACVGGTEFNDSSNLGAYWSVTNGKGMSSALGYIPELAWNESSWAGAIYATGGGISTVYPRPSWQSGPGVPPGTMRLVPDLAATSAVHDAYVIQVQGKPFYIAGTSAATPSLASVMALVLQNGGSRVGNANPALYALASQQAGGGRAVFHDITNGNNSVPGVSGYSAARGYDMVTGLGSIDAFLLVNNWNKSRSSNFSLAAASTCISVVAGSSTTATLTMSTQGGFNSPVTLSAAGVPSGVTVTFSSTIITSAAPVTMIVTAATSAAAATSSLTITGTGGGFQRTLSFILNISAPTFTLTPTPAGISVPAGSAGSIVLSVARQAGFNAAITLSVSGLFKGLTANFIATSIPAPGSGSRTLTVSAASTVAAGISSLTVTATGGGVSKVQAISLTILTPTFTLTPSATSVSLAPGGSIQLKLSATSLNGFRSAIALSASSLPKGVTATFTPASIASPGTGSSILKLSAASALATGNSTFTVAATGGGVAKTQAIGLSVSAAVAKR